MASSILTTLFMSTILFSFSSKNIVTSSSSLIGEACSKTLEPKICFQFLQSQPQVVSARNLDNLATGILKSGTSNVTKTFKYLEKSLNKPGIAPNVKAALLECKASYDNVIGTFGNAIKGVKKHDLSSGTATYDLHVACFDYMQPCIDAVASAKINDETILYGNNAAQLFGSYASVVIEKLEKLEKID
ncbi:hypothetical protein BUALT_Bualt08G0101700 [Buddleja alternifolia]|uniref:Pectinesterase inhibitor domain-containing protein n=1 Tax=Buddleja alternifolia TaxID=168488 RepID=A0AAV6X6N5_9LAMI|nr:hypothetical protein BUALT_Bualt08G0101700 [Buddleja alternifolia]